MASTAAPKIPTNQHRKPTAAAGCLEGVTGRRGASSDARLINRLVSFEELQVQSWREQVARGGLTQDQQGASFYVLWPRSWSGFHHRGAVPLCGAPPALGSGDEAAGTTPPPVRARGIWAEVGGWLNAAAPARSDEGLGGASDGGGAGESVRVEPGGDGEHPASVAPHVHVHPRHLREVELRGDTGVFRYR
ncbi:hypothetical protein EYF80_061973 [Liparis tanakae]|uniref:Uncharacterized protein n=1 Tax=Liparis tanakae TaxID=230148 RepID=A0A4Z2EGV4_9TELE|nr:hypothetical protein EYF80_061973 [Liparis tanakae]